jgi:SAM-dependent methyltransferase
MSDFMLEKRTLEQELLDGPDFGLQEVRDTFRFLVPVNRWLGGVRPQVRFFERESRSWERHKTYRILDAGCGIGDVPIALVKWGRRQGYRLQVDAVDRHPLIVEHARQACQDYPEIALFCQDVFEFEGQGYDYVHAAQFVHHFRDEKVPEVLAYLLSRCRCKLVVNDLLRAPLFYAATWFVTLFASAVSRHDARVSVKRGFTIGELEKLLRDGGFQDYSLERHFFYRFLLVVGK